MQNSIYEKDIKAAVEVMRKGGVILYPTDTVWGIGCDATNPEAVKRVFDIKRREDSKALICLVDSEGRLQRYVRNVPSVAWPGKNTGVGCHFLLQGIFPTQGSNPGLQYCRQML